MNTATLAIMEFLTFAQTILSEILRKQKNWERKLFMSHAIRQTRRMSMLVLPLKFAKEAEIIAQAPLMTVGMITADIPIV